MINKKFYIGLFAALYLIVAIVSTVHAIAFFNLANQLILGIMLALGFEIGQAAVLFSILTSPEERNKFMPWTLMCILTAVQILGNIFSSYKYLVLNSADELRYFKEPLAAFVTIPDSTANVIITLIVGGILPLVALCMTGMITNYLSDVKKLPEPSLNTVTNSDNTVIQPKEEMMPEEEQMPLEASFKTEPPKEDIEPEPDKESRFINL